MLTSVSNAASIDQIELGPRPKLFPPDLPWPRSIPAEVVEGTKDTGRKAGNHRIRTLAINDFGDWAIVSPDLSQLASVDPFGLRIDYWFLSLLNVCVQGAKRVPDNPALMRNRLGSWNAVCNQLSRVGGRVRLEGVQFSRLDLRYLSLRHVDMNLAAFMFCDLRGACWHECKYDRARFIGTQLDGVEFRSCSLDDLAIWHGSKAPGLRMYNCSCRGARIPGVDLSKSVFVGTNLQYSDLRGADLAGAQFGYYDIYANYKMQTACNLQECKMGHACFVDASLAKASGYRFDRNQIRGTEIPGDASDPWSTLRRKYTGPWFFIHVAFLAIFILPYAGRVLALTGASEAALYVEDHVEFDQRVHAVLVLIGWTEGWWITLLAIVLAIYNLMRGVLTYNIGMLREAEDRSGVTPALHQYMGSQLLEEEALHRTGSVVLQEIPRWIATSLRWIIEWSSWRGLSLLIKMTDRDRDMIRPRNLLLSDIGYWRLHRLMRIFTILAVVSFLSGSLHWIFTTTVPDLR